MVDSVQKYVESFNSVKELMADFVQYHNVPEYKGLAILNAVISHINFPYFERINLFSVEQPDWCDQEIVHDSRISLLTDNGHAYITSDSLIGSDEKLVLYQRAYPVSVHCGYGDRVYKEMYIKSEAINNMAQLFNEFIN